MRSILKFINNESGASAAEYALILAIIATAIVTALTFLSGAIGAAINSAGTVVNP